MAADPTALTPRESAVLDAVGRRLGNPEIAAELVVSVRTVESHVASLRRKLGAGTRAALVAAAEARRAARVAVPQNSFVGRERELRSLRDVLERHRCVTVVGPAGCGKTRLALELAAEETRRLPVVADLEKATPTTVPAVVAKAAGVGADGARDPVAALATALATRPHLLVLDTCDRVPAAAEALVATLLARCRSLRVLATSRAPVGASDETVFTLEPLPLGPGGEAVRLFTDRAGDALRGRYDGAGGAGGAGVDPAGAETVCRLLDGLPLAIELAAARLRQLPLAELAARLEHGFDTLVRDGPLARHRTLEAAFGWTWDLLDDEERRVLGRLAALPVSFDLELGERVAGPGSAAVLLRLVDRSLVSRVPGDRVPAGFRILGSLRAFVAARTTASTVEEVRRVHAEHHAEKARALRARARVDDSPAAAAAARDLCLDVNAAVDWALAGGHADLALDLARSLAVGGEQFGPDLDSLGSVARCARDPRVRSEASPEALLELGLALCHVDLDLVDELARVAVDRDVRDREELHARLLAGLGAAYRHRGREALAHLDRAEELAEALGETWCLGLARQTRGIALRGRELADPEAAMAAFAAARDTFAAAGDALHVNNARYLMAATAAESGSHVEEAVRWAEDCEAYARDTDNVHELAHATLTRLSLTGAGAEAERLVPGLLATFAAVGDQRCLARGHLLLAAARSGAARVHELERARAVSRSAHDVELEASALERLVEAFWEGRQERRAARWYGALTALVGPDEAARRCPPALAAGLDGLAGAVAEGAASARS